MAFVFLAGWAGLAIGSKAQQSHATVRAAEAARGTGGARTHFALRYAQQDQGPESPDRILHRVRLLLKSTPEAQAELTAFLEQQRTPTNADFHRWLTPLQFAQRFGSPQASIEKATAWLQAHGMTEIEVSNGNRSITFAGSVSNISAAFKTEIHTYKVDEVSHFSNTVEATLPYELNNDVVGVVGLSDFQPRSQAVRVRPDYAQSNGGLNLMGPDDLATMYDLHPFYAQNVDGSGITIAIPGDAQILLSDYQSYRSTFGLNPNDYQIVEVPNMQDGLAGSGSDGALEATLDLELAGALAHNAKILYIQGTNVVDGAAYVIDNQLAQILSFSFGECETGAPFDHIFYQQMAQQANAEGITWVAASGDNGPANCDWSPELKATQGFAALLPASVPEVSAVGGTRVQYPSGSPYWSATNDANEGNVLEYIPEQVWNDSESGGAGHADGPIAAGGGPSAYFPLPGFQAGFAARGIVNRMTPDISLNASDGWAPDAIFINGTLTAVGGTSASTPIFASMLAVLQQYMIVNKQLTTPGLGNVNPTLYNTYLNAPSAFHDITGGDNKVDCVIGTPDCTTGRMGYAATAGYDEASGLGSLDAFVLASNWKANQASPSATTLSVNLSDQTAGQKVIFTTETTSISGNPQNGVVALSYTNPTNPLYANNVTGSDLPGPFPATGVVDSTGAASISTSLLPVGVNTVTANYGGSTTVNSSISSSVTVTVSPLSTTTTVNVPVNSAAVGETVSFTATVTTPSGGSPILSTSLPGNTGWIYFYDQSGSPYSSTQLITSNTTTFTTPPLVAGANQFTVAFAGTAYTSGSQSTFTITGTNTPATLTHLTESSAQVALGSPATFTAQVSAYATTMPLTGKVTFFDAGASLGSSTLSASGTAGFTTTSLSLGSHSITAAYSGNIAGSTSGALTVTVVAAPANTSTTSMTASASQIATGTSVALKATVAETGTATIPSGVVLFCDATAAFCASNHLLGTAQLNSAGTAILRLIPGVGSHSYVARYVGTNSVAGSVSVALSVAVSGPVASATTILSSGSISDYGLAATVTGFGPDAPTGSISFLDITAGNSLLGTATLSADTPAFQMSTSTLVGTEPYSLISADFNRDGIPDLAVTNLASQTLTILLGDGKGGFTRACSDIPVGGLPYSLNVGDFNADGNLDLAVINSTDDSVMIYLGDGTGNFTAVSSAWPGAYPTQIAVADVNGDGIPDLIVLNAGQNIGTVNVLLGDGTGNFTPVSSSLKVTTDSYQMAVADFNGDGKPDLAIAELFNDQVAIYLGNGDGTFTAAPSLPTIFLPQSIAAGDLNGDGATDLAISNGNGQISVFLGNGDGMFTASPVPTAGVGAGLISIGDVDGDGIPDLVVADTVSSVVVLIGNGDGSFSSSTNSATGLTPNGGILADLNGDGIPDMVLTDAVDSVLDIFLTQQSATATAAGISPVGTGTHQVDASYKGDNNFAASISPPIGLSASLATTPSIGVTLGSSSITTTQPLSVTVVVSGGTGDPTPTGSIVLASGSYASAAAALSSGDATINIPAGSLSVGIDTITATYTPDTNSSLTYRSATGTSSTVTVTKATQTITFANPGTQTVGTPLALSATASSGLPVSFTSTTTGICTVSGTTATFITSGTCTIDANQTGNSSYAPAPQVQQGFTVNAAPGFTLSASPTTLSVAQSGNGTTTITMTEIGGFSGTVSLSASGLPGGVTASFAPGTAAGTQVLTLTATTSTTITSAPVTVTITGTSGALSASTSVALTITAEPGFTAGIGGTTSITLNPGATTGNSGTISVAGTNGFNGMVSLTCAVTTAMTGVNDAPTCSLSPASVALGGTTAQTSTLTVATTAASSAENRMKKAFWPSTGGTALALILLFVVPRRQRNWFAMLGLLVLFVSIGAMGCGGGGGSGGGGGGGGNSGTTTGSYTITVTGISGSISATVGTISLTVQ